MCSHARRFPEMAAIPPTRDLIDLCSSNATISAIGWLPVTMDGRHVRGLGCGGVGPGAVRLHDVVSHRISGLHDRACKLSRGARSALAVDRTRSLHHPV